MNQDKAREYFSAYAEGTLEAGLSQAFKQRLEADPDLMAEYVGFEETLRELDGLKFVPVEVPHDLHDRIQARLDKDIWDKKQATGPKLALWVRNLSMVGIAAALVVCTILSLNARNGGVAPSSAINTPVNVGHLDSTPKGNAANVTYTAQGHEEVTIDSGEKVRTLTLDNQLGESLLNNPGKTSAEFKVKSKNDEMFVVLPGSEPLKAKSGHGSIEDFAKAFAGFYRVQVVVHGKTAPETFNWDFDKTDAYAMANAVLKDTPYAGAEAKGGEIILRYNAKN